MHLHFRNVNDAFRSIIQGICNAERYKTERLHSECNEYPIVRTTSRYGDVLQIAEPVLITYSNPLERVLFNEARDCNPFSLLYESLYMLSGRNDVAPLTYYTKRFSEFSDDGKSLNDAYGYRWRKAIDNCNGRCQIEVDQLKVIIDHLKSKPDSRRAVLNMWNVEDDLVKINNSKAVCCNLEVMFSLRNTDPTGLTTAGIVLDMTVTNRSNDLLWGLLNANYVTFSVLQEYVAAHLGVEVGKYHHFTNNLHIYTKRWEPEKWLADKTPDYYTKPDVTGLEDAAYYWGRDLGKRFPLVKDPVVFDKELPELVEEFSHTERSTQTTGRLAGTYEEPFLYKVAVPMLQAFRLYKHNLLKDAIAQIEHVEADDWRIAGKSWLRRRMEKKLVLKE